PGGTGPARRSPTGRDGAAGGPAARVGVTGPVAGGAPAPRGDRRRHGGTAARDRDRAAPRHRPAGSAASRAARDRSADPAQRRLGGRGTGARGRTPVGGPTPGTRGCASDGAARVRPGGTGSAAAGEGGRRQ